MPHPAIRPGEVAVVTGAGLGIGRAMARRFAAEGMAVMLLDVDAEHLHDARNSINGDTGAMLCDVAEFEALEMVRERVVETWGKAPTVIVNNAVTRAGRGMWAPLSDWHRALEVNVMGVVNGVRAFVPTMIESGRPGMVVNVGSKQGITNPPGHPVYNMAKAAVKTFTEQLAHELRQTEGCQVTTHLLVPGFTATGTSTEPKPGAWRPEQVVDAMMDATERGSFYIVCPDNEVSPARDKARILWGAEDITEDRPALSRWHPDWKDAFARKEPR
jgi:NAD(P)-dependent dehydrogenase (short-subunit alcohol dehydrogenase family)